MRSGSGRFGPRRVGARREDGTGTGAGVRGRTGAVPGVAAAVALSAAMLAGCAASGSRNTGGQHGSSRVQSVPVTAAAGTGSGTSPPAAPTSKSLLTYDYGNARDGVGPTTPLLTRIGPVPAWSRPLSGGIYGQPLVVGNEVIVATEDDEVYGLKASSGGVLWHFSIGSPVAAGTYRSTPGLSGCGDISPIGITGTPVINSAGNEIFVAGEVERAGMSDWEGIEHVMVAASFGVNSAKVRWVREIDPPGAGTTYLVPAEQQRSSLTLAGGTVYAEFGGLSGDCGRYQGYVVGLPVTGAGPLSYLRVPTSREGAIWAVGGAAVGPSGELYVATGNSANESPGEALDYGDAVLGLTPADGRLKIDGYFSPANWRALNLGDRDLGSAGPIVLPGGKLIFEIGKTPPDGVSTGYLLDPASLGGLGRPLYSGAVCPNGGYVFGAEASEVLAVKGAHVTYIFVPCPSGTVALSVGGRAGAPRFSVAWTSSSGNGPPIVAGGLVWSLATGADGGSGAPRLYGLNPLTGALVVSRATMPVEHFATPGAAAGRIFVATDDGVEAFAPA